jgi:hypothetical protein
MVDEKNISSIFDFTMGNAHNYDFLVGDGNVSAHRSRQGQTCLHSAGDVVCRGKFLVYPSVNVGAFCLGDLAGSIWFKSIKWAGRLRIVPIAASLSRNI